MDDMWLCLMEAQHHVSAKRMTTGRHLEMSSLSFSSIDSIYIPFFDENFTKLFIGNMK